MKQTERNFLNMIAVKGERSVRDVINNQNEIPHKQCWYYLEKWTRKGWYEYGVSLDLGWLTPEGMEVA